MDQRDYEYREMRDIWSDFNHRQEFEHDLIHRKTTWLLTTEGLLFAAYGLSFRAQESPDGFRIALAVSGLLIALITLLGVGAVIKSKRVSWHDYRDFFKKPEAPDLPQPFEDQELEWGVRTRNTCWTLLPDALLPIVFIVTWPLLLTSSL